MKTIKISDKMYFDLLDIASDLQKRKKQKASFEDALKEIMEKRKGKDSIMDLAGSWKMSDEEAKSLLDEIYKERRAPSRRL